MVYENIMYVWKLSITSILYSILTAVWYLCLYLEYGVCSKRSEWVPSLGPSSPLFTHFEKVWIIIWKMTMLLYLYIFIVIFDSGHRPSKRWHKCSRWHACHVKQISMGNIGTKPSPLSYDSKIWAKIPWWIEWCNRYWWHARLDIWV